MLKLENVHHRFGDKEIIRDVSLTVPQGQTLALIGASGSGKTTLLRLTLGILPLQKGWIKIGDRSLSSFTPSDWAARIGYVPQEGGLFPHLSGRQNITLIPKLRKKSKEETDSRLEELRQLVALDAAILDQYPHQMSGGQRQRVAIMRAAMMNPDVMVLDEPMAALDPLLRSGLQEDLKEIFRRLQKTVLIVTHDLGEAVFLAERISLLHKGQVVQSGTYADLVLRPTDPLVTQFIGAQRTLPDVRDLA